MHRTTTSTTADPGAWARASARLFAGSCFFPYPALAIGGNNGLQLSQGLALAAAPLLCGLAPGKPLRALLLLLTPIYISMFINVMFGDVPSPGVLPKEAASLTLALVVLWPAEWLARPALFREVLVAAAAAILAHAAIGLYQVYCFTHDEFPLLFLYRNPSFKSMEEWSQVYARYIRRPCGLFPEPSAMAASLGPWIVLLTGLLIDPGVGKPLGRLGGRLASVAVASGFLLLALSRSGSTFAIMAAVLVLCLGKVRPWSGALSAGKLLTLSLVLAAVSAVLVYAAAQLSGGLEDRVESSWGLRGMSIQAGLMANTDPSSLAVGVGPGQSTPIIRRELAWVPLPPDQDELAIFSLAVCYYMETGLVGALALAAVLATAVRAVARSTAPLLGWSSMAAWLVGVMATTSYMSLSAIWLFLGALLCWDRLFPRPPAPVATEGRR